MFFFHDGDDGPLLTLVMVIEEDSRPGSTFCSTNFGKNWERAGGTDL